MRSGTPRGPSEPPLADSSATTTPRDTATGDELVPPVLRPRPVERPRPKVKVSPDVLIALRAWSVSVTSRLATVVVPMTRDEMRAVVHHLDVWCCELESARATDAIFNDAMNEVSRQPEARTLDPPLAVVGKLRLAAPA